MNKFYTEIAYLLGLASLALGTTFMEAANFGVSMVVAPAYILYSKLSQTWGFFTFGMAEYIVQALLLILLFVLVKKFKISFFFSFATAIIYGIMLDCFMTAFSFIQTDLILAKLIMFVVGLLLGAFGVSLFFHTYISPEVYELFVKEISTKYKFEIHKVKTFYDCTSCAIGVIMSFALFGVGHFEGVKAGTIICALINGWIIRCFSHLLESNWEFDDGTNLRKYFS